MDSNQQQILVYLAKLEKQLIKIYGSTYQAAVEINAVRQAIEQGDTFSWSGNRQAAAQVDKLLQQLSAKVQTIIANGIVSCYRQGERHVTGDVIKALGIRNRQMQKEVTEISDTATDQRREQGVTAAARLNARRGGIQASSRIWKENAKKELEIIIQNGIKEGKSPQEVAQSIRPYLLDEHRYEKSVYNPATGRLERSEAARNYHPGQGVYRSSFKNALRMARTEMTQAYRAAEWESYQNNPLVTAYEIKLSGNHTTKKTVKGKSVVVPLTDICDKLAGVYPKTFKWEGWHPQCRCYMVPVTVGKSDFRKLIEARQADRKAKREGKEATAVRQLEQRAANRPLPQQYTDWLKANQGRIDEARKRGGSIPQWITDNYPNQQPTTKPTILQQAAQRHAARTQETIDRLRAMIAARKSYFDVMQLADEWGGKGWFDELQQAYKNQDAAEISRHAADARKYIAGVSQKYTDTIANATALIAKAKPLGVGTAELERLVAAIRKDKKTFPHATMQREIGEAIVKVTDAIKSMASQLDTINDTLAKTGIAYNDVKPNKTELTDEQIYTKLCGGDKTKGSCSSLAFAYAGNRAGYDVLDYRDGSSREFFSRSGNIVEIAKRTGGIIERNTSDFTKAKSLLSNVQKGKEYYFTCGKHAAVVRMKADGSGLEYLEMQSSIENGWKTLTTDVLKRRFGAQRSHSIYGHKLETSDVIIDIELLKKDPGFRRLLGYINTAKDKQHKGSSGTIK